MDEPIILSLKDLLIKRNGAEIISGFTAEVRGGEIILLTGENGSGKTTLLNSIAGNLEIEKGELSCGGKKADVESENWKKTLSFIPDDGGVIPLLTVREQIMLNCFLSGIEKPESGKRTNSLIRLFELNRFQDYRGEELSAGTRKKLGIALGIVREAKIFLFDEPFSTMDLSGAAVLMKIIKTLKSAGRIVIIATHSPVVLKDLYDGVWKISGGRVEAFSGETGLDEFDKSVETPCAGDSPEPELVWLK